jgi:hypothetical protein
MSQSTPAPQRVGARQPGVLTLSIVSAGLTIILLLTICIGWPRLTADAVMHIGPKGPDGVGSPAPMALVAAIVGGLIAACVLTFVARRRKDWWDTSAKLGAGAFFAAGGAGWGLSAGVAIAAFAAGSRPGAMPDAASAALIGMLAGAVVANVLFMVLAPSVWRDDDEPHNGTNPAMTASG